MTFLHKLAQRLARLKTALIVGAVATIACEIPVATDPAGTVVQLHISPKTSILRTGQMTQFIVVGLTTTGDTASIAMSWSVTGGAMVDTSSSGRKHYGQYRSPSAPGRFQVVARTSALTDSAIVDVSAVPVVAVVVSPTATSAVVGQTVQLAAAPLDSTGAALSGRAVTWLSSNSGVASVSASGLVTGVGAGSATMTATSEGKSGTAAVTVTPAPVASVSVSPASVSVTAGQTVQFTATPRDANGTALAGRVVTWSSGNTPAATVSGSGLVTAVAAGSATITATSEGTTGTAAITVTQTPAPVASVSVTPASASVTAGQTVQFTATPRDANGTALAGRVVTWSSGNTAAATVSGSGLVTGVAAGSATITATSEGQSGTAAITVTAAVTNPGTVSGLAVASVTVNSATLSFTEVTDGAGLPASYLVRFAVAPLAWASATDVTQGSCAVPLAGTTIGATRTCTVLGLTASTSYQFQLVAFRGTLNVNAVFGALSTVASGTTSTSTAPVASVTLSPGSAGVTVGATQQLTATLKDASGNALTGRTVTWASSAPLVASVSSGGLVTGLLAGSATITATSEGQSGTAAITVAALPPPGTWPNEPAGLTVRTDWGLDVALPSGYPLDVTIPGSPSWHVVYEQSPGTAHGYTQLVTDLTAPFSPSGVYDFVYPQGMVEGNAPATVYYPGLGASEVYAGFWWKPSAPFDPGPNGNKIAFMFNGGGGAGGQQFIILLPDGRLHVLPEYPGDYRWRDPNVNATPVTLGAWHRVEWFSNVATGVLKYWLDGVLQGSYTDVRNSYSFDMFQFSPTWGGNSGAQKRETDHYWFDHVHLSVR